jgi:hypothetical protein
MAETKRMGTVDMVVANIVVAMVAMVGSDEDGKFAVVSALR